MWKFLSRGHGETEGFSNGSLAEFKGHPLQSLAREICQNSLDAASSQDKPVIVEFEEYYIPIDQFPGMDGMKTVIDACAEYWKTKADVNTSTFLNCAKKHFKNEKFMVLRVSDYNTTGLRGAFSGEDITPWGSLVKGNAFSVKSDSSNAAGSYGIGKAAPFVSSFIQTVFYRTLDVEGNRAALGVARLMAHESVESVPENEDPVRRSVGYFGSNDDGTPAICFEELDRLNTRNTSGTDLFIPGFLYGTEDESWIKEILKEIVDNFLYSIYTGKLEIRIQSHTLTRKNLRDMLDYIGSKDAKIFYEVIRNNDAVSEVVYENFHSLGNLRLRLLYGNDLNKKILVVRNSGMRIAKISSLPRMISYTGFLELQGSELNAFFRAMENPKHDAWEPKRHGNPEKARQIKAEVEEWVIEKIVEKLIELNGEESDVDVSGYFNYDDESEKKSVDNIKETMSDDSEKVVAEVITEKPQQNGKFSIRDEGRSANTRRASGTVDSEGTAIGTRTPTGGVNGGRKKGRRVNPEISGPDSVYSGDGGKPREVAIRARVISKGNGNNKLIFSAAENITKGKIAVITQGENGKSMGLKVKDASGTNVSCECGVIVVTNVEANVKYEGEFELVDKNNGSITNFVGFRIPLVTLTAHIE